MDYCNGFQRLAVTVDGERIGEIGRGLMVLVAVHRDDEEQCIARMAERLLGYRVFPDAEGRMNRSVRDIEGGLVAGSAVHADGRHPEGNTGQLSRKARRPTRRPNISTGWWRPAARRIELVETGRFGADMQVALINDGPVTFWLET